SRFWIAVFLFSFTPVAGEVPPSVSKTLQTHCVHCHGTVDANADVDLQALLHVPFANAELSTWESVIDQIRDGTMPPADEPGLSRPQRDELLRWYRSSLQNVSAHPGFRQPRRLSAHEYRNTLHSVFGFPLKVAVIEAEQTDTETSLVMKLLPEDPPGPSGFKNDTSGNPLTTHVLEQYSYLIDNALERLFTEERGRLAPMAGSNDAGLTKATARRILQSFARRAYRRPVTDSELIAAQTAITSSNDETLEETLRAELKTLLLAPRFLFRGLMAGSIEAENGFHRVDDFELAERLSYFLWADMPDEELLETAAQSSLTDDRVFTEQIERMLASPKARSLAENLGVEWFSLDEIDQVSNNPPVRDALKSQPIDYLHFLFTQNRPVNELVLSDYSFVNPHTAKFYPTDRAQLTNYKRSKGIEIERVSNQRITLDKTSGHRGGLLTMPGILAMNRGPILRGTWILERVLGEHLPDPPANVGVVPPRVPGSRLSFRERFESHRDNPACASCHDKLDPLGFALQHYGDDGRYLPLGQTLKKRRKPSDREPSPQEDIDASGQLPGGETFADFQELRQILVTSRRDQVVRNITERVLAYALCRQLTLQDRPTVDSIANQLRHHDATFGELIHAIARSLPFRFVALRETSK
ncbi:MAG: DUF1592 domain-containing protein, partial [Planctomycetota bacterium]